MTLSQLALSIKVGHSFLFLKQGFQAVMSATDMYMYSDVVKHGLQEEVAPTAAVMRRGGDAVT